VKVENGELVFQGGRPDAPTGPEYRARIENGKLVGHHSLTVGGGRGRATDRGRTRLARRRRCARGHAMSPVQRGFILAPG